MQIISLSGTKYLWLPQYVNKFLVWHKKIGPAQSIFGPVKGQGTKNNSTECKSSFCLAQNACDCHNMKINFWSGTKNLDQHKTFWDL